MMLIAAHPVTILQAGDFAAIAFHFRGLRIKNDVDILQAADFILQHLVGFHLWGKLQQGYVLYDARQVNGGFHAGVPAADYRYAFALKQRTIAVRAVGHALGAILIFARHVHIAPFRPGGDDDATRLEHRAGGGFDLMQAALCRRRRQFGRTLGVDHVDVIVIDVRFQRACQLLAFGFRHRNIVFDIHGIQHLTAEAFAHQAGTNPFTCRVDRRRRAGRAGANDQYIVSVTLIQLFRCAFSAPVSTLATISVSVIRP